MLGSIRRRRIGDAKEKTAHRRIAYGRLAAIFEDEVIEVDAEALARTRARRAAIGGDGLLFGVMPGTPLGMLSVASPN